MPIVTIEYLLSLLAMYGGRIVSSASLSSVDIAQAQADDRMYVDENGFGYVWERTRTPTQISDCIHYQLIEGEQVVKTTPTHTEILKNFFGGEAIFENHKLPELIRKLFKISKQVNK